MLKKVWMATVLAMASSGPIMAQSIIETPVAKVQYAVSEAQPDSDSSLWQSVKPGLAGEADIAGVQQFKHFWLRAKTDGADANWAVYGPLAGESQDLQVTTIEDQGKPLAVQFSGSSGSVEKGFKCCKVRVRVRIVTKLPKVTVNPGSVKVHWRGPIPQVTARGQAVKIEDLPRLPSPEFEPKIPTEGSIPNAGMRCEIVQGEAKLWVQNGEKYSIDVWLNWKDVDFYGPIRIEGGTERSIGHAGYSDCKIATDNIYITKAVAV